MPVTGGAVERGGAVTLGPPGAGVVVGPAVGDPLAAGALGDAKNSAVTEIPLSGWLATTRWLPAGVAGTSNWPWKLPSAATAMLLATSWPAKVTVTGWQVAPPQKLLPVKETVLKGPP